MATSEFDLIIVGAGPGGYVCALKAAQLGLKTALVEKRKHLGGTCLNVGCIPSKALLHSTEMYHFARHQAAGHGIVAENLRVEIDKLMKQKSSVVDKLRGGIAQLVKARKITVLNGHGKLLGGGKVEVSGEEKQTVTGKNIVIATGSKPAELPFMKYDGDFVVSSDEAIAFDKIPEKLVVVGGGAIGLELGSVWSRLGSEVTIVEFLPHIAAFMDDDVCKLAARVFKKQGMNILTDTKVTGLAEEKKKRFVTVEAKGKEEKIEADKVLVAIGRVPCNDDLGLEELGVEMDKRRIVQVDENFQTNVKGVYAIGDTIPGPMLAHKAEEEGVALAEKLAGHWGEVNYDVIPNVIYTDPELASVGLGEKMAKEKGLKYKVGKFPFAANGRALANDASDGMAKVIADEKTDRILGVQLIGRGTSELIAEAVAHMEYGGSAEDLGRTVHAHPTMSEALKEAGLAVDKAAIHAM